MNIGQAAKASGVNAKMIRHYETLGIIPKAQRSFSGYRMYTENDIHLLTFIKRARSLGFSMKEIKKLVSLWKNKARASADVKDLATAHVKKLEEKIIELQEMVNALQHLSRSCHGDHRPDCPILEKLAEQ